MLNNFITFWKKMMSAPERLENYLAIVEHKLNSLEAHSLGARAVYLGDHRVLMKCVVAGANIAFLLESDDRLLTPWFVVSGEYETSLTKYIVPRLKPDSRCIDVGANFGYFSCLFSRFCPQGNIVGIEADPKIAELLRDNLFINGFHDRARALNFAVSNNSTPLTMYRRSTRSGNTSIINLPESYTNVMGEKPVEAFTVPATTIDEIACGLEGKVDFLKIDVEGAEPLVFRGATNTILKNPSLTIICEWAPGQITAAGFSLTEFLQELRMLGLNAYEIDGAGQERPMTFMELENSPYMAGVVLRR